ncbi:hypothetical protein G6F70_009090 [Rhizopus microsporus]|nr:hypothetical protein G6F71_009055 [Rhizopus microsporus]KAG1193280.1 hypothetical protein G6F70_009090 [Rhizopus microsporus]KAG1206111.1 hypothetical protein G6F69_009068 [Rhizopus microsporus]KAG1226232.1 hypothetical protein G6F67_009063 [Rhizopus microsporus]KAG1257706.1 hypothetical protein G6F68_009173 [Rhizopus microsporus]
MSNFHSYKFPKELDTSVPDFFCDNRVLDWNFELFNAAYLSNQRGLNINEILDLYRQSIKKIMSNNGVPNAVKSIAGHLLKDFTHLVVQSMVVSILTVVTKEVEMINHLQESCWQINNESDFWDAWGQYMDICECHQFCLERYHVIQCGYSIKCQPHIPQELYDQLGTDSQIITSPFKTNQQYTTHVLNAFKNMTNMEDIQEAIKGKSVADKGLQGFDFCKTFFKECTVFFKKPNLIKRLAFNETSFNRLLVWPLWDIAVDSIGDTLIVIPGEYILKASQEECKADGVVLDGEIEIGILETSGKYLLNDNSKYGLDHVKGTFGALAIFNTIFKTYYTATEVTAMNLKIPFVHARHDHVHLWSLELCAKKLYALKKVFKFKIPGDKSDVKNILAMGHFVWQLKKQLEQAHYVVQQMKQEHDDNEINRIMDDGDIEIESLKSWINLEIKKPVKGAEYGLLLPVEKNGDEENLRFVKF